MRKLLNTLFVTTSGAYVAKEGECIVVKVDGEVRLRVPFHALEGVVCLGQVGCSPQAMEACTESGITLTFLTEHGRFLARVEGRQTGSINLRRSQYRKSCDVNDALHLSKSIVFAKILNSRQVLLRAMRDHGARHDFIAVREVVRHLRWYGLRVKDATTLDELRGLEGDTARRYFSVLRHLVTREDHAFDFSERSRRPPLDRINCLLSFVYTLLVHDCRGALEAVGLDPQAGFLHRDRPGRPSLALDLMEEFRAPMCDRLVLSLVNRQQISSSDFEVSAAGGVTLRDKARKTVLCAWQDRKKEELIHPFLREKLPLGVFHHVQARLLARSIRGDLDAYPPFFWR